MFIVAIRLYVKPLPFKMSIRKDQSMLILQKNIFGNKVNLY